MDNLRTAPVIRHGTAHTNWPTALKNRTHVFIRRDKHKPPLTRPYDSPYRVVSSSAKFYTVDMGTRLDNISVDHLKPAPVDDNTVHPSSTTLRPQVKPGLNVHAGVCPNDNKVRTYSQANTTAHRTTLIRVLGGGGGGGGELWHLLILNIMLIFVLTTFTNYRLKSLKVHALCLWRWKSFDATSNLTVGNTAQEPLDLHTLIFTADTSFSM